MAKTKAARILELESMLEAVQVNNRHLRDRDKQRIAHLERDRALLLAHVQADEELWSLTGPDLRDSDERGIETRFNTARTALIAAGLLEGEDDDA